MQETKGDSPSAGAKPRMGIPSGVPDSAIYISAFCPRCKMWTTADGAGNIRQRHGRGMPPVWCPYDGPALEFKGQPWGTWGHAYHPYREA